MRRLLNFLLGPKKIKARPEDVIFEALGMVYDVCHDDIVELSFRYPEGHEVIHSLKLPGHDLRIGQFVTLTYRKGRKLAR